MKKILEKAKIFGIWIIAFMLYFIIVPFILGSLFQSSFQSSNMIIANISLALSEVIIFLSVLLIYNKVVINDAKKFKKDYRKNLDIGFKYYCIGLLVMIASNLILTFIMGNGSIATNEELNRQYLVKFPLYSIIAMIFVGPPLEEIIFRLGFRKAFNKEILYCLFSALVFGGLHVYTAFDGLTLSEALKNWMQVLYIIPYGSLGFAFAKVYYKTDNIWTSMTIHMMHNAITVLLIVATLRG